MFLTGETFMEIQLRLLKEKEVKIRKALRKLKKNRGLLRKQRKKSEFPIISVMGYTNCGKDHHPGYSHKHVYAFV